MSFYSSSSSSSFSNLSSISDRARRMALIASFSEEMTLRSAQLSSFSSEAAARIESLGRQRNQFRPHDPTDAQLFAKLQDALSEHNQRLTHERRCSQLLVDARALIGVVDPIHLEENHGAQLSDYGVEDEEDEGWEVEEYSDDDDPPRTKRRLRYSEGSTESQSTIPLSEQATQPLYEEEEDQFEQKDEEDAPTQRMEEDQDEEKVTGTRQLLPQTLRYAAPLDSLWRMKETEWGIIQVGATGSCGVESVIALVRETPPDGHEFPRSLVVDMRTRLVNTVLRHWDRFKSDVRKEYKRHQKESKEPENELTNKQLKEWYIRNRSDVHNWISIYPDLAALATSYGIGFAVHNRSSSDDPKKWVWALAHNDQQEVPPQHYAVIILKDGHFRPCAFRAQGTPTWNYWMSPIELDVLIDLKTDRDTLFYKKWPFPNVNEPPSYQPSLPDSLSEQLQEQQEQVVVEALVKKSSNLQKLTRFLASHQLEDDKGKKQQQSATGGRWRRRMG